MARREASSSRVLTENPVLRDEFWHYLSVSGMPDNLNQSLEYASATSAVDVTSYQAPQTSVFARLAVHPQLSTVWA
jgi:hypothetical protein